MKKTFLILAALAISFYAKPGVILDEIFNYSDFGTDSGWTTTGTNITGTERLIGDAALTYSNEGGTYILSGEGKVLNHDYQGGSGNLCISYKRFTRLSSGSVYLSYLYRTNASQSQSNGELLGFSDSSESPAVRAWAGKDSSGNQNPFRLGITRISGSGSDIQWASAPLLNVGETYLIVIKYDIDAGKASLFINPVINSQTEPIPVCFDDSRGTAKASIEYLMFRNTGNNKSVYDISGVRLSTTWTEAVAAKSTAPQLTAPVALNASDITSNSVVANWNTDVNAAGYIVKLYKGSVVSATYDVDGQSRNSYEITGLLPNTAYSYTIIAKGDGVGFSNSDESDAITFTTDKALSYTKISTDFNDGTWGEIATELPTDYPTYEVNGFTLEKAIVHTGSMTCPSGERHTNRITMDTKSKGGVIVLPLLKDVGEIEIHANAGTEGNQFNLDELVGETWSTIGTYAARKTPDSVYVVTMNRAVETKLRISNNSNGKIVIYKIASRTYQETQELNITATTPAEGSTCYYNLTKSISLNFNKEIDFGTGSIMLNDVSIPVSSCTIDGKTVTVPVTLESNPSGKGYTMTIPEGAFVEKDNVANLSNQKVLNFSTYKTVSLPAGYSSQIDVVYSTANVDQNRMDIYYPTTASTPVPVVINIHGGGWNHGEKESQSGFNVYFNMEFAVANVEYRMTPHATAPAAIEDVRCAMKYLLAHADELNIDPNKIIFQGGSAGGHLALVAGYLQNDERFDAGCNSYSGSYKILAVIDKYGPSQLTDFMFYTSLVNWLGDKATDTEFVESISPALMVTANTPPTYVIHGNADPTVPYAQSETLVAALQDAGVKHMFTTVPDGGHGGFSSEYNTQMNNEITVFLNEILDSPTVSLQPDEIMSDKVKVVVRDGLLEVYSDEACKTDVYDMSGCIVLSSTNESIDLSSLSKGVLLVKVNTNNRSYIYKIVR